MTGRPLREGFTTGSAATAAVVAALRALYLNETPSFVTITAPAGELTIPVRSVVRSDRAATAIVVKDGGDDPDCTHGLEIVAHVAGGGELPPRETVTELALSRRFRFAAGCGIGIVTKLGIGIAVGEPAINPVPRKMIRENAEALLAVAAPKARPLVLLSVPAGADAARRTLNGRLGIVGGISILGTTGVVRPVSMEAFTATIDLSLAMARANGRDTVVLCFGRQSEDGAKRELGMSDDAYVMIGDFFRYGLEKAKAMGFRVVLSGQPGKLLKACLDSDNTNVKYGVFSPDQTAALLERLGVGGRRVRKLAAAATARHMWEITERERMTDVWDRVARFLAGRFGIGVLIFSYEGELLAKR